MSSFATSQLSDIFPHTCDFYYSHTSYYSCFFFFFFNDTATTEIYTLSLHDALPISIRRILRGGRYISPSVGETLADDRSEEHTSELQSHVNLVCRLLLEKKKKKKIKEASSNNILRINRTAHKHS